jgi:helicase
MKLASHEYLISILEQFRGILRTPAFADARRLLSGDSLLAQIEEEFERTAAASVDDLVSIAFRIEQIAIRLWTDDEYGMQYRAQAKEAFEAAAKLFEQLAEAQSIPSRRVHLDLYLHSAVDFSLGEFQANATVLARKVLDRFEFDTDGHSRVLKATFLLLMRNLTDLEADLSYLGQTKATVEETVQRRVASGELDRDGAMEEIAHFITLEAILNFARYLRTGQDERYGVARSKIGNSLQIFNAIRDPDNFVLTQLISFLIRQMHFSSLWHQLGDLYGFRKNPILTRYIRVLTTDKRPIYELWQSQIEALPGTLGDSSAVVLQMPTSAGKTRVAEFKIAHTLATSPEPVRCIYIAPFKSLAAQVEESLDYYLAKVGYRVTSVFGSYESIEFEDFLVEQSDVLVITPEKLDYLLRQDRDFFTTVKLIVVDEGHLLDNDIRGLRLEILLQRLRRAFTDQGLQLLFLSAVVPNSEEIAAWLTQDQPVVVDSKWKPTKLRQGIFYWGPDWKGRIRYPDDELVLITDLERRTIQEFYKNRPGKRLKKPKYYPDTKYDIAIELALDFRKASPTILFTAVRKYHVDSIAKNLQRRIQEIRTTNGDFHLAPDSKGVLERLARRVERRLGPGFPLATYIREGFAYHHGQLPDDLRQAIEEAFRRGHLPILIATPTLAQGVNLPVHLMIVANLERGGDEPFPVRDFRNIAGRAGRALHETEGQVIFVQNTQSGWLVTQMYRYLRDDAVESVQSVLFKLYKQLVQRKLGISLEEFLTNPRTVAFTDEDIESGDKLDTAFQTQILALLYEELLNETDPDTVQEALAQMLFGIQCERSRTYYEPLVEYSKQQVRYITARFRSQTQRNAFYRTGFSLRSCQDLEKEIRHLAAEGVFTRLRDPFTELLDNEILARILHLVSIPQETQGKYTGSVDLTQAMIRWINFADVSDLVANYEETDVSFQNPLFVSDLVYKHFMNDTPWALNSMVKILTYLRGEEGLDFDPEIGLLASYVKYGVNTPVAAYVSGMGISDRGIARTMADYYYREVNPALLPSVEDFQEWVQGLTFEDLLPIFRDRQLVQEVISILSRYKFDARPVDYFTNPGTIDFKTYVVGLHYENRLEYLSQVNEGDELKLVREPDNAFDPYAMAVYANIGHKLGYICSSKAFVLSTLSDEGWQFNCYAERMFPAPRHPNRRLLVHIPPPLPF